LARGFQKLFAYQTSISALAPGKIAVVDVKLPTGQVYLMYDFEISTENTEVISLAVSSVIAGVETPLFAKGGNQTVTVHLTKGFPIFDTVRTKVRNRSLVQLDIDFHMAGISLPETQYYLRASAGSQGTWE
jgi:hypothetical protein